MDSKLEQVNKELKQLEEENERYQNIIADNRLKIDSQEKYKCRIIKEKVLEFKDKLIGKFLKYTKQGYEHFHRIILVEKITYADSTLYIEGPVFSVTMTHISFFENGQDCPWLDRITEINETGIYTETERFEVITEEEAMKDLKNTLTLANSLFNKKKQDDENNRGTEN